MGHIFTPPLDALVEFCARELGIEMFVETGTFRGESAAWAAERFREVITIERSPGLYAQSRDNAVHNNIVFRNGHSPDFLPELTALPKAKLFWLDAHWCGLDGDSAGAECQCAILAELSALRGSASDDVIMIDDFHMFAVPPPPPFRADEWPSLDELFSLIRELPQPKIFVVGNALVLVGGRRVQPLVEFLIAHCTV
ncbi:MAG: hypothetical protein JSS02_07675 [Planctomycetes bacterium]|nr:hypothetical protein [Planctomycetota bacterium]